MARPTSGGWKAAVLNWVPTLLFNVVLPTATYSVLSGQGHGEVTSLLVSGVWPVLETVGTLTWQRKVDEFSIFTLIFLALSVVAALGFNSPRLLLVKESAVTGLFGVVLLASLLAPRPLMFYFGRKFATNGTPESIAWWNGLWQYAGFRSTQMIITAVWGVAMVTESLLHIWLTYQLSVASAVVVFNILPFVVTGLLIFWTVSFGKRRSARAAAAGWFGTSGLDATHVSVPVLVAAIAFGLSVDYEVFLLSRIRERKLITGDNRTAVAEGLQHSGRIITSAALLLCIVFAGFLTAGFVPVQAIGLGLTLAVALDATVVRLLLVPATMTIAGRWNWWAPPPLRRLHTRLGLAGTPPDIPSSTAADPTITQGSNR